MKVLSNITCFILLLCSTLGFAEWSQWRGPNRDGVVTGFSTPDVWPKQLTKIWQVEVDSGDASPVVGNQRTYVHTRQGEYEVVTAIELGNGRVVWQDSYGPVPYLWPWLGAESRGKGPFSTPALYGGKLYTFGVTQALSAYDVETGKMLWRKDFKKHLGFGSSTSPIVADGLCIIHVGEPADGALTAFDALTGEAVWRWDGDGPSYASPILAQIAGTEQLVALTRKHVIGISPKTGQLLWKVDATHPWDENIPTPVRYGDTFILSAVEKGTRAIRVSKDADAWSTEQVWHNPDLSMYTHSPVLSDDVLYGFTSQRKGQFFCMDARTGAVLWTSEGRQGEYASIVSAGTVLFCLTGDAELIVVKKNTKAFEPIARYTVADSPTWAHPIIFNNHMLIKDASTLTLWRIAEPELSDSSVPDLTTPMPSVPSLGTTVKTATELKTIVWEKDGVEMVRIPAGEFQMGGGVGDSDEKPVHTVHLDAFYVDKYEVTNAQYQKFIDATGYATPKYWDEPKYNQPNQPVVGVTWYDAMAYAEWAGKRLLTEAEWEKAARGGLTGAMYPWGNETPDAGERHRANYDFLGFNSDVQRETYSVGEFAPNGYGLYDMAGNVWEWCLDEYNEAFYAQSRKENPLAGDVLSTLVRNYRQTHAQRVLRGGAWDTYDNLIRVANRNRYDPAGVHNDVGFRCGFSPVP